MPPQRRLLRWWLCRGFRGYRWVCGVQGRLWGGRHKAHAQGADKGWQSIVLIQGSAAACYHGEYVSHQTQMNVYIQKSSYVFSEKMIIQLIRVFEFIFVTWYEHDAPLHMNTPMIKQIMMTAHGQFPPQEPMNWRSSEPVANPDPISKAVIEAPNIIACLILTLLLLFSIIMWKISFL